MPPYSDLQDFYKLQAECSESHVIHMLYVKDRSQSVPRVKVEQRWDNVFGEVWLQKGEKGAERAVKPLSKYRMEDLGIDYERELDALAKFNTPRVSSRSHSLLTFPATQKWTLVFLATRDFHLIHCSCQLRAC